MSILYVLDDLNSAKMSDAPLVIEHNAACAVHAVLVLNSVNM